MLLAGLLGLHGCAMGTGEDLERDDTDTALLAPSGCPSGPDGMDQQAVDAMETMNRLRKNAKLAMSGNAQCLEAAAKEIAKRSRTEPGQAAELVNFLSIAWANGGMAAYDDAALKAFAKSLKDASAGAKWAAAPCR